jgi:hypothetical protein
VPIDRVHVPGMAAFSARGLIRPHHPPRHHGPSSSLLIEWIRVMIVISYSPPSPMLARRITITIDRHRSKTMTKSMMHRLIDMHFSLIQILVPIIESAWGTEEGYLLVRDLGDQLRRVMSELESLDG